MRGQIIALGGGGFSSESSPVLDDYILQQTGKDMPKICFLPTASGDADSYIVRFYAAFSSRHCRPVHLSLFRPPTSDLESFLLDCDVIYVGCGNARNMLAVWKEWKIDKYLQRAWENRVMLCGAGAGAICWFTQGLAESYPGTLAKMDGLKLLPGSVAPHYDGEWQRRPTFHEMIGNGTLAGGYGVDDGVALHFFGTELYRVVSSRPKATAYRVSAENRAAVEQPLKSYFLEETSALAEGE